MTRAQVLALTLVLLLLGGLTYGVAEAGGLDAFPAGLAASSLLMVIVIGWTLTYLLRVVTGRMTFGEQRRRYRADYDARTDAELLERFEALPAEEQARLLAELDLERQGSGEGGATSP